MSGITKKNIDQSLKFVYSDNNSLSVIFHDNNLLMGVVGEFNKNLQELGNNSKNDKESSIIAKIATITRIMDSRTETTKITGIINNSQELARIKQELQQNHKNYQELSRVVNSCNLKYLLYKHW